MPEKINARSDIEQFERSIDTIHSFFARHNNLGLYIKSNMTSSFSTTAPVRSASIGFHYKRISWAAIFAGTLVALGIQLLFSLLGIGIGMGALDPLHDRNPVEGIGTGALVWWVVSFLLALFIGGWVSGKLSRTMNRFESIMHGILTWIIFVLFNFYLLTSIAGSVMSAAGGVLGGATSAAGQKLTAFSPMSSGGMNQSANTLYKDSASMQRYTDSMKAQAPAAEARARKAADDTASALSKAGIAAFVGLLLGAIIAGIGSNIGRGDDFRGEYEPAMAPAYIPER